MLKRHPGVFKAMIHHLTALNVTAERCRNATQTPHSAADHAAKEAEQLDIPHFCDRGLAVPRLWSTQCPKQHCKAGHCRLLPAFKPFNHSILAGATEHRSRSAKISCYKHCLPFAHSFGPSLRTLNTFSCPTSCESFVHPHHYSSIQEARFSGRLPSIAVLLVQE